MIRYVKTIDELIEVIDKEFNGSNALCPICKHSIGSVNIPNIELGVPELKFMQFKHPGIFCTQGHCIISMEDSEKQDKSFSAKPGNCKLHLEDIGIKVFEVMKLIKPYLDIDESIPNAQLYWLLMNKGNEVYTKSLASEDAYDLSDRLQKLGARVKII